MKLSPWNYPWDYKNDTYAISVNSLFNESTNTALESQLDSCPHI